MTRSNITLISHQVISALLNAVDPAKAVKRHMTFENNIIKVDNRSYNVLDKDIRLIAIGKASVPMAQAVIDILGEWVNAGVIVTKYGHVPANLALTPTITVIESAHPVPDENSQWAGEMVCDMLTHCTKDTIVIACVSGGASALQIAPYPGISLNVMQAVNSALLRSGADIIEMNAVRSRLDRLKAGGLVRMAQPGQVIGLILSDVIGDPLAVIASGLTNDSAAYNVLVGNNAQACQAAASAATALGYNTRIVTSQMIGEARECGEDIAKNIMNQPAKSCLIYGGETTVTITGNGKGGRNQELALSAAIVFDRASNAHADRSFSIIALGTDGTDGPTDAAGAIATSQTLNQARLQQLSAPDYLARNDSYAFFYTLGDLIMTGPTGTNTADVVIAFAD